MGLKDFFAKVMVCLERGKYWISYLNFFMIVFLTVTSMREYQAFGFLRSAHWIVLIVLVAFIVVFFIGYLDIKRGIYEKEKLVEAKINPVQKRIFKELDYICDNVKWHTKGKTATTKKRNQKGI